MRVIIDCNVVVSAALRSNTCQRVIAEAMNNHTILLTAEILSEYLRVAGYRKFPAPVQNRIRTLADDMAALATHIPIFGAIPDIEEMPDTKDVMYIVAAHVGQADAIITGNHRDFTAPRYGSARVLSATEFLALTGAI